MKKIIVTALGLLLALFILPLLLVEGPSEEKGEEEPQLLPATPTPARREEDGGIDAAALVRVKMGDKVTEMTMADYLWSVTAAEMPASFESEALKAQAVTARTYALWKMEHGEDNHPDADVCTDITCCQAYITKEEAAKGWGDFAQAYTRKIADAVAGTDGTVMTYNGETVQAVFFSSANGRTEDAVAVWGSAVPYLVGVDSPEGENVPNYRTQVTVSAQEFKEIFLKVYPGADLSGEPSGWFENLTETESGRVASLDVGGLTVEGTKLRALFSLRSTGFTVEAGEDTVTFSVTGYGHGVGMSQYGANTLAGAGKSWQEILTWYYTGVKLEKM